MTPFLSSTSGRLLLTAAAIFLAAGAAGVISHSLYAVGIGFPAGITLSFVAVGLGIGDYTKQTLLSVILLPPALWGFYYLTAQLMEDPSSLGYGMALLALVAIGKAAFPSTAEQS